MKLRVAVLGLCLYAQTDFDAAKRRALGEGLVKDMLRGSRPLGDAIVQRYLHGVCERLAGKAGVPLQFEIVQAFDFREPLGLPGGIVIVPATALLDSVNEAELAGLIAHAIGHASHPRGVAALEADGFAHVFWRPHSEPLPLGLIPQSQRLELEMDRFGARLAQDAGYDAGGLESFVRRTQAPNAARSWMPPKMERLAALAPFADSPGQTTSSAFVHAKERLQATIRPARAPTLRR